MILHEEINMEELLFESKGVTKKYKLVNTICNFVMVFSGLFMLLMRNVKRGTVGVSTYGGGRFISTGNLGGYENDIVSL